MTAPWSEVTLPTILSNYELKDIFNADEFGLLYQCHPNKTYHFKGKNCSARKSSKVRLIGMSAASATGEKLPMLVIGKSKNPRCFKNVKDLLYFYKAHKKSWMDSQIFEKWIRELDLLLGNCPAHLSISNLNNIQFIFLPRNTTSALQPMHQGVITIFKAYYRRRMVRLFYK